VCRRKQGKSRKKKLGKYLFNINTTTRARKSSSVARDDERASEENEWGNYWPERFFIRGERKTKYVKCSWISALEKDLQILLFVSCCYFFSSLRLLLPFRSLRSCDDLSLRFIWAEMYIYTYIKLLNNKEGGR
jgi:hypothetical protein